MKKVLLIVLPVLMLLNFIPSKEADAAAFVAVPKVVVGSMGARVLMGIAEKAGLNYVTRDARTRTVEAFNMYMYEEVKMLQANGYTAEADNLIAFADMLANVTPAQARELSDKTGYASLLVDTAAFLTGADLLWDIYQNQLVHKNEQKYLEVMRDYAVGLSSGEYVSSFRGNRCRQWNNGGSFQWAFGSDTTISGHFTSLYNSTTMSPDKPCIINITRVQKIYPEDPNSSYYLDFKFFGFSSLGTQSGTGSRTNFTVSTAMMVEDFDRASYIPTESQMPQKTELSWRTELPPVYPEQVEVIHPIDDNYPEQITEPWNEPETLEVAPEPTVPTDPTGPTDPEPEDKPAGSSWWDWLLSPLIKLIELMKAAIDGLVDIVKGLAKAIADAIGAIFVPSEGFFNGFFDEIKLTWDSKIPITGQLSDFMNTVKSSSGDASRPVIEVDLPERYGGVTVSIIDFSYFEQYRDWILNFIRFFAWFVFLKKLFARLPRIIGG